MADNGKPVCDFCRAPDVKWSYPARPFVLSAAGIDASGEIEPIAALGIDEWWAACDECHTLIERDDRTGVLRRSVETSEREGEMRANPELRAILIHGITMIHGAFYANRTGPAQPAAVA